MWSGTWAANHGAIRSACSLNAFCDTKEPTRHPNSDNAVWTAFLSFPEPLSSCSLPQTGPRPRLTSSHMSAYTPIMPRPTMPPTPQPSTDITGKSSANAPQLETAFTLPPAALNGRGSIASSSEPSENASDSSYRPPSPSSPVATSKPGHARKRSSTGAQQGVITKDDYSLPPPPTRSRKIIQMKPKDSQEPPKQQAQPQGTKATPNTANGSKRKQPSNTTAAGRKIARKTAHSLIERRRRSKMNEEFGVLKDMIPACRGQEMHKLAILQVRICRLGCGPLHLLILFPGIDRVYAISRAVHLGSQDSPLAA